jgi:hypothetical protein
MRWLVVGITVFGIASTSLIGVAPANAGQSGTARHEEPGGANCGADGLRNRLVFNHTSDDLTAYDDCSDGWGADGEILIASTGRHEVCNNNGTAPSSKLCPFDFSEGKLGTILASSDDDGEFRGSGTPKGIIT